MQRILLSLFVITGIFLMIFGIKFKSLNISRSLSKRKSTDRTLLDLLDRITSIRLIQKPLEALSLNKELLINRMSLKILELSEVGISLQQMYFLKIVCLIICTFLVLNINYTNIDYQTKIIVESSREGEVVFYQENQNSQSKYLLYRQVIAAIGKDKLSNSSTTDIRDIVQAEMAECLNTMDNQLIEEKTEWFINTWKEVQNLKLLKYYHILIILLAVFIPEFLLIVRWLLRGCIYKKEIIKLEYIFELLARVDGIKTLDIIRELEKSSKIYSKYLREFGQMFKFDKKKGFDYLNSRNIKSLSKLTNVLEIYSLADKEIALQVLEREIMERDESIIFTAEETIDFIDLVAFLSIVPLVYELARLMLKPMLDVVYKAFEFI